MKKITLLFMLMVASVSFAQLKTSSVEKGVDVGRVGVMGTNQVILQKFSDLHVLSYKDMEYPQIDEWKNFEITNSEVNDLYDLIVKGIEEKKNEETVIELEKATISVKFFKSLGGTNIQIVHWLTKDGSVKGLVQIMTKKQVDKLFGKKK